MEKTLRCLAGSELSTCGGTLWTMMMKLMRGTPVPPVSGAKRGFKFKAAQCGVYLTTKIIQLYYPM